MGISQVLEEKLCSGGRGAGRETSSWKQHAGGGNMAGTAKRQQEGARFGRLLFACFCFVYLFIVVVLVAFLLVLKWEGLVSSVFQGRESMNNWSVGRPI